MKAVRSGILSDYQLVAGAGRYEINVLVRESGPPPRFDLAGRVMDSSRRHYPVVGLDLGIVDGEGRLLGAITQTDDFGQFRLSAPQEALCGLRLGERTDAPCMYISED